jgi:hypothetical protein
VIARNGDDARSFARGYLGSTLRRVVEDWSDLMRTKDGRTKALSEVALAATVLEMDGPTLVEWVNATSSSFGGESL